jgi:hypothetical protein
LFLAGQKEILIYQCFYFTKTAKNAIFGSLLLRSGYNSDKLRFYAWFMLQSRGLMEFSLLVSASAAPAGSSFKIGTQGPAATGWPSMGVSSEAALAPEQGGLFVFPLRQSLHSYCVLV